ncbi:hypothetical protein [Pseudomonas abyssi]|uniref:Uncharacterized protein n=1 Tax=Pseudomonas abyssi TaxID=170540 RepID=A0A395R4L4_9PSED|nr:hypothetical protein [Halopseudomonas gallaeciensis]RGP55033.1 hypothetical protein ASB58_08085 [Halopseudomonas gallaeciensis]
MFLTILAGVSVFVIGQFVLKLILEPIVSFKESLGALSASVLGIQRKITNCAATPDDRKEMHLVISMILVKKQGIPFYPTVARLLRLPSEQDLIESCRTLNFISTEMVKEMSMHKGGMAGTIEISEGLKEVSDKLGVRVDFSPR